MLHGYKIAALCVTKIHEDTVRLFIDTFHKKLREQGWRVFVYTAISDLYWKTDFDTGEKVIYDLIDFSVVDALFIFEGKIMDSDVTARLRSRAAEKNVPIFLIDGSDTDCYNIRFDYDNGFANIIRHLADEHGVRDFHYITGFKDNQFSDMRLATMRRVLKEYGITLTDSMISYGNFWSEPAKHAVQALIASNRVPRAIVCANDTMALAASATLIQHGYRVPEDVIVTGFDGIDAIKLSVPKITSGHCDFHALGDLAADTLLRYDQGEAIDRTTYLLPTLLLQASCGCAACEPEDSVDFFNELTDNFNRFRSEDEKLSEVIASIQSSQNSYSVSQKLHGRLFYSMTTVLKPECLDFTLNPQMKHSEEAFDKTMIVLSDSDIANEFESHEISIHEIVPRLADKLQLGIPLVFIALHAFDVPLGYLCFHYADVSKQNYLKINQIASALNSAIGGFRNLQYQQHLQTMIEDMYKYDTLTGLHNRNGFLRKYQQLIQFNMPETMTLVLCDLDGLKYINDHFSHREGDNAISVAADALHAACATGLCSRYGGDELIAVLPHPCDHDKIRESILQYLANYNRTSGKPYQVSVSIGIHTSAHADFERMFYEADQKMYLDKLQKPHRR